MHAVLHFMDRPFKVSFFWHFYASLCFDANKSTIVKSGKRYGKICVVFLLMIKSEYDFGLDFGWCDVIYVISP